VSLVGFFVVPNCINENKVLYPNAMKINEIRACRFCFVNSQNTINPMFITKYTGYPSAINSKYHIVCGEKQ
jgi:hypothetical protein